MLPSRMFGFSKICRSGQWPGKPKYRGFGETHKIVDKKPKDFYAIFFDAKVSFLVGRVAQNRGFCFAQKGEKLKMVKKMTKN